MLAELALIASRRAESALGPAAGLAVIRAALDGAQGEARRTLLLAGLGTAVRAGDGRAFGALASEWASAEGGADEERGLSLVARLIETRRDLATTLAEAELARARTARALWVMAALAERRGEDPTRWLDEARTLGAGTSMQARAERALLGHPAPERVEEAARAIVSSAPADVLRLAPVALGSTRLYTRVRVLDQLVELAEQPAFRVAALRVALSYTDLRGACLGPLEQDRVRSIATRAVASPAIQSALAGRPVAPATLVAAREALAGQPPSEDPTRARDLDLALRAIAARTSESPSAPLLLSALATHAPSPAGWTAVLHGLGDARARPAAVACAAAWIDRGVAPPRGFTSLAASLARVDEAELAERAWSWAVRANEPGARARLAASLEHAARRAHAAGDRLAARRLIERAIAIDPEG